MPGDAVAATTELLSPDIVDKMAAAAGLDLATTRRAVHAGIPAILSGLIDSVCKPAGVRRLACAVVKQPPDPWQGVAHTADGWTRLAQDGGNLLVSLLGGESVAALASSIGKLTGASGEATRTLLSLLAPAIVCALGQERRNAGVDALGIADVLRSQKDLVAAAIPADLASSCSRAVFTNTSALPSRRRDKAGQRERWRPRQPHGRCRCWRSRPRRGSSWAIGQIGRWAANAPAWPLRPRKWRMAQPTTSPSLRRSEATGFPPLHIRGAASTVVRV